ncbi:MAG: hypothetical protein WCK51_09545 [Armatimonadota bacterium]
MKKFTLVLGLVVVGALFAGCSGGETAPEGAGKNAPEAVKADKANLNQGVGDTEKLPGSN